MPKVTQTSPPKKLRKPRPAMTPEARENQLIALAIDRVEQRIIDGTASSQELIHYLKLGSEKNQLEMEKLRKENELLTAKTSALESTKNIEEMYIKVIAAMRSYNGADEEYED